MLGAALQTTRLVLSLVMPDGQGVVSSNLIDLMVMLSVKEARRRTRRFD